MIRTALAKWIAQKESPRIGGVGLGLCCKELCVLPSKETPGQGYRPCVARAIEQCSQCRCVIIDWFTVDRQPTVTIQAGKPLLTNLFIFHKRFVNHNKSPKLDTEQIAKQSVFIERFKDANIFGSAPHSIITKPPRCTLMLCFSFWVAANDNRPALMLGPLSLQPRIPECINLILHCKSPINFSKNSASHALALTHDSMRAAKLLVSENCEVRRILAIWSAYSAERKMYPQRQRTDADNKSHLFSQYFSSQLTDVSDKYRIAA